MSNDVRAGCACTYSYSGAELSTKSGHFTLQWPSPLASSGPSHTDDSAFSSQLPQKNMDPSRPPHASARCAHYVFVADERERVRLELHLSPAPPLNTANERDAFGRTNPHPKPKAASGCERWLRVYASLDAFEVDDESRRDVELCLTPLISPGTFRHSNCICLWIK